MIGPTPKQATVLTYIREAISTTGFAPTFREICKVLGVRNPNTATCHLDALERKGFIRRARNKSRAIQVVQQPGSICPLCGSVKETEQEASR